MPRQSNGTYDLPLPNVISGDIVEAAWANTSLNDIAQALTDSLSRTGQGNSSEPLLVVDGAKNAPGLGFISEANTGMYRAAAGDLRFTVLNTDYLRMGTNGFQFTLNNGTDWTTPAGYSEGEWTPQITGFDMAAGNGGLWSRIGKQVTLFADVKWTTLTGAPTDELYVSGLPYEIRTPTNGSARMFPASFMAWNNVNVSGRGFNGDIEVFTRALIKDPGGAPKTLKFVVYIGANDVNVTAITTSGGQAQKAEPLTSASPSLFANQVVAPTLQELLPNGEFSFSLTYLTDDPLS